MNDPLILLISIYFGIGFIIALYNYMVCRGVFNPSGLMVITLILLFAWPYFIYEYFKEY